MQHATQGMAHAPYRLWLLLQMMDQLVHQVLPVIIHREPGVVTVLRQMGHRIFRGQGGKQLAVGGRREAIGVGKKHVLRHTGSINKNRGGLSPCPAPTAMTVTARNDDTHATRYRAGGCSPSGTTAMVRRETQLALPSSLLRRMSHTWVVRPI